MGEAVPALISDLALILTVAGITTIFFKRLKQPLVLGYVLAGFLAGPNMPYTPSVQDMSDIQMWSDIGVIFLLFGLGLEFSFKKILKMGTAPIIAACSIIFFMISLGTLAGRFFEWSKMDCLFLGGMLAMSSTTIIYKAFDDLGLRQQRFTGLVLSVLILEDILAILLMVVLSTLAVSSNFEGSELVFSMLKLVFFLVLWFVVGIYLIPVFFRKNRSQMSDETMLVVALGLCFFLVVLASYAGFSSAFGAFMMGSILAETIEAERIERLITPVKDLFGAIFFVSVGMLVDPSILIEYWLPILVITLTILFGQAIFGSISFIFSGQTLKVAMQCGFSMAQIGEFAFIIASLGVSLGVTSSHLYPIVVAVSVITTFLTPYMIRLSEPAYKLIDRRLPVRIKLLLEKYATGNDVSSYSHSSVWHSFLMSLLRNTGVYLILSIAVVLIMEHGLYPFLSKVFPASIVSYVTCLLSLLLVSPFLRLLVVKKNNSAEFIQLWHSSRMNRLPLVFTVVFRFLLAMVVVSYIITYYINLSTGLLLLLAFLAIGAILASKKLKAGTQEMEKTFNENLRSRDIRAEYQGIKQPKFAGRLLSRDLHLTEVRIPEDSKWGGQTLQTLDLGKKYGIHISSIQRGSRRFNIPQGTDVIFPGDKLQVIGTDEQLKDFVTHMNGQVYEPDMNIEEHEMKLRQLVVTEDSYLCGKTLRESGLRNKYHCMVVGLEQGEEALRAPDVDTPLKDGDVIWVVGEVDNIKKISLQL
ncbi:MAG: cation:proton antiporter [Bacteroidaceae bacterium]|nr:cation:proton antiporter [Bacteroidaceae bacterium]